MAVDQAKSLKDVAAELGVSYSAAWRAAHKGVLPTVQPLGKGTRLYLPENYSDFIGKSLRDEAEVTE